MLKIKQLRSRFSSLNVLVRSTFQSISSNAAEDSRPIQPRVIFRNRRPLCPRGGRDNQSDNEDSFPSFFAKNDAENVRREPRLVIVRPTVVNEYSHCLTGESDVLLE